MPFVDEHMAPLLEAALEFLKTQQQDLLLSDHSLPGMSGLELITQVHGSAPQIKLIMMTGHGNIDDAVSATRPRCGG